MPNPDVERALLDGARRSMMACSLPVHEPFAVRIWRRHRWPLVAGGLFVLLELLGSLIGSNLRHF